MFGEHGIVALGDFMELRHERRISRVSGGDQRVAQEPSALAASHRASTGCVLPRLVVEFEDPSDFLANVATVDEGAMPVTQILRDRAGIFDRRVGDAACGV